MQKIRDGLNYAHMYVRLRRYVLMKERGYIILHIPQCAQVFVVGLSLPILIL